MISGSIRFTGTLPTWLVIMISVVSALGVLWYYRRETRSLDSPSNYLIPSLRAAAIALTLLTLSGPVWRQTRTIGTLGRVIFAIDVTQSMSVTDSKGDPDSPNRLYRAVSLLMGSSEQPGWVQTLSKTHEVDVVAFSSGSPTVVSISSERLEPTETDSGSDSTLHSLTADAAYTDISSALGHAISALRRHGDDASDSFEAAQETESSEENQASKANQRAAIVLLSDGRDNSGDSPLDLAKRARHLGTSVYTIGMGSEDELVDVSIVSIEHPSNVAAEGLMSGTIELEQFSLENQSLNVQVETADGKVVWQKQVVASKSNRMSIPFDINIQTLVKQIGSEAPRGINRNAVVLDLRASVSVDNRNTSDANARNNTKAFRVAASTRDRRLLILDGSSRWETRYLRNLFRRDPSWKVDMVVFGPGTDQPQIVRGESPGQFPATAEAIARYDAVVMGELPADQFEVFDGDLIRHFVSRGGGLILIDGPYGELRQICETRFGDLVPVRYTGGTVSDVKSVRPTRVGSDQPLMSLMSNQQHSIELWNVLPAPRIANATHVKPGGEIWGALVDQRGNESPWLTTSLFGSGRVFHLASDQTWRWRYKVADRIHARFWNQLVTAVMQPPYSASDDYISIGTNKIEYRNGEPIVIRVRVQGPNGSPISDATVDALVMRENQIVATVPLLIDDANRGSYRGEAALTDSGKYDIRIRVSGFDTQAIQASTPIWVFPKDSTEWSRISLDRETLEAIANQGGGEYFHESNASSVLEKLRPLSSGQTVESEFLLWQSYYWFVAIVALLAAEWLLRKRSGLV